MLPSTASFSPAPCVEYFCVKNLFPCLGFGWISGFPKKTFPQNLPKTYLWFGGFPQKLFPAKSSQNIFVVWWFPQANPKIDIIHYLHHNVRLAPKVSERYSKHAKLDFWSKDRPMYIYIYLQSKIQNHCSKFKIVRSIKF